MNRNLQKALLVIWVIIIFILTGYPDIEAPKVKAFSIDKIYHFILFFVLGLLQKNILKIKYFFLLGCSVILIAEAQQLFIPGRDFEIFDIFAGIIGLIVVYLIFKAKRSSKNDLSKA